MFRIHVMPFEQAFKMSKIFEHFSILKLHMGSPCKMCIHYVGGYLVHLGISSVNREGFREYIRRNIMGTLKGIS